jgi:tRNA (uracil-5-)-methyltransferase
MDCKYFGICGGCQLGQFTYEEQLQHKLDIQKERFKELNISSFDIIKSEDGSFRNRAEFRIFKDYDENNNRTLSYAMFDIDKKLLCIESCSIVSPQITLLMSQLLEALRQVEILNHKIFSVEFLNALDGDMLVTLIYHKKLDEEWNDKAKDIENKLNIKIIGRSRKQKIVLSQDYINEEIEVSGQKFKYQYLEGGFTQPNQKLNEQMIEWVITNSTHDDDLCELYCGGGNFTLPLSRYFKSVLATEVSKTSINSAKKNCALNNISNIKFIRLAAEEFVKAKNGVREFRRLKEENVNLHDYTFSTIFVDPPRAGLDDTTRKLVSEFDQIIYISCNPETLKRDLDEITKTHSIKKFAFFDQFAYSKHIESGVILTKK